MGALTKVVSIPKPPTPYMVGSTATDYLWVRHRWDMALEAWVPYTVGVPKPAKPPPIPTTPRPPVPVPVPVPYAAVPVPIPRFSNTSLLPDSIDAAMFIALYGAWAAKNPYGSLDAFVASLAS